MRGIFFTILVNFIERHIYRYGDNVFWQLGFCSNRVFMLILLFFFGISGLLSGRWVYVVSHELRASLKLV